MGGQGAAPCPSPDPDLLPSRVAYSLERLFYTDDVEQPLSTTPPIEPPNGHSVSNAELYKTLYLMDQRLAERDTALIGMVGTLRTDFSTHTKDGHPFTQNAEVIKEEIKLDAKKAGLVAALLAFATFCASGISAVLDKWVF